MATVKQKLAFRKVLKGSTLTKAMTDVGYAPTTASTTGKLTNTLGWKELTDKYISEKALMKVHREGLQATFTDKYNEDAPDYSTRHKYLETGYKIRGRITPEVTPGDTTVNLTQIVINPPHATTEIGNQSDV